MAQEVYIFQFAFLVAKLVVGTGLLFRKFYIKGLILHNICCSVYILYVIQFKKRKTRALDDLITLM